MFSARRLLIAVIAVASLAALPTTADARTTWLCRPGATDNPCDVDLRTTRISPSGETLDVVDVERAEDPEVDCFYVYPTVSDQPTPQANFTVTPELRSIALYQAARYSSECRVWAPVYRQITIAGLLAPTTVTIAMREVAYEDVRTAWRRYLGKYNKGRGVVLIGHSQGTSVLRRLIREEIDPDADVRERLVSAILLGGNTLVREGSDRGGDFQNIRACRSEDQVGCVITFVTFDEPVPANSRFGRTTEANREVLCANPAALGGGSGRADPIFPTEPFDPEGAIGALTPLVGFTVPEDVDTPWVEAPNAYKARCSAEGGADVLQISPRAGAPDLNPLPDATWGLHLVDANIALGNLIELVRTQIRFHVGGE